MKPSRFVRSIAVVAGFLLMPSLASASSDFQPLQKVEGIIVHSSVSSSSFTLEDGRYVECQDSSPSIRGKRCKLEGAQVVVKSDNGQEMSLPLTTFSYFESQLSGRLSKHYIFRGLWKVTRDNLDIESPFAITIIRQDLDALGKVQGYLAVEDLAVSEQVRARIVAN